MKCYLHIGTQKTGSTTLQQFLSINRAMLAQQGYFVPQSSGQTKDWLLMVACYDPDRRTNATHNLGIHTERQLEIFRACTLRSLKQECNKTNLPYLILSSEDFHGSLTSVTELNRLKNSLTYIGCNNIQVIVYLRDPAELANSKYCGMIAGGATEKNPPPPEDYKQHCDHRQTLERWSDIFGNENILARIHEKTSLVNASIIDDFVQCIGASLTPGMILPSNINTVLSHNALELIRRVNEKLPETSMYQTFLRAALTSHIKSHITGPNYVMPEEYFRAYDAAYADSNEWTRKHWFPERDQLFSREHRPLPSICDIPQEQLDQYIDLLITLWKKRPAETLAIWKKILTTTIFRSSAYRALNCLRSLP